MKLLVDENIDPGIVEWLRVERYDVLFARESTMGADDLVLVELANAQGRVVTTRDKDFGELVYRRALSLPGVVLLRYQSATRQEALDIFFNQWPVILRHMPGHFVVLTDTALRVRPL